jgi:hypothetical protein
LILLGMAWIANNSTESAATCPVFITNLYYWIHTSALCRISLHFDLKVTLAFLTWINEAVTWLNTPHNH